ncbi:MAG: hypothetical protein J0M17_20200 [Planctomycetes bacterium]|nr:hypothetical protein [Planctomycetota bacterium]
MRRASIVIFVLLVLLIVERIASNYLVFDSSAVIVSATIDAGGRSIHLSIEEVEGSYLYANAIEQRFWSNGRRSTVLIGSVAEIGVTNPEIAYAPGAPEALIRIGNASIRYDVGNQDFDLPKVGVR